MLKKYDFLIVGAGLFGAVFAREATDRGRRVLVIDSRDHVGGNCYTEEREGIQVHVYGSHIFHTANARTWAYINRFADFNHYYHRVKVNFEGRLYSFPINLMTLHQIWGVITPQDAERKLATVRQPVANSRNLEEWCLSQVGEELYRTFIQGYTAKQWGRMPTDLPASIIKRLPVRMTYDDHYFHTHDRYEGIPVGGYTAIFDRMLAGIEVRTGVDFFEERELLASLADRIVYTGPIDRLFGYRWGALDYRSLRFVHDVRDGDYQGCAVVNYTSAAVPYTRVVEHKHFAFSDAPRTVVTFEYPERFTGTNIPYYPINDKQNNTLYARYAEAARGSDMIMGGRLASYKYMDMDMVIGQALNRADQELG